MRGTLAVLVLLGLCLSLAHGGTMIYENKELEEGETLRFKVGLITEEDAWVGDDATFLHINQDFTPEKATNGRVEVLVYYSAYANAVGYEADDGFIHYCCTAELHESGRCGHAEVGQVITTDEHVQRFPLDFRGNGTRPLDKNFHEISASGMYYVKYFNCPGSGVGRVRIDGTIQWANPFGQLSAELYPFVWFFAIMTVAYLVLGFLWIVLSALHWSRLLVLQNCIAAVIGLGMIECITWYFDFLSYNHSGNFNWGAIAIGVFTSTVKRTVSRLLVLSVSMGFGVVKVNLGGDTQKVGIMGAAYFIFSFAQQMLLTYLREGDNEMLSLLATVVIFPVALLDTTFYWWIFLSLMRTINTLNLRHQEAKLQMYTRFFIVLAISAVLTILVIAYQTLLVVTQEEDAMWGSWWLFKAFWEVLYFVVLAAIAVLWRPTTNNTRYAYAEADDIEMMIPGASSRKRPSKGGDGAIDTGSELHLDLDKFSSSFLDDEEEKQEQLSKMQ